MTLEEIGDSMRQAREDLGISRTELSRRSGVHYNCILAYEQGTVVPGVVALIRLANALGLPLDDYVGRRIPYGMPGDPWVLRDTTVQWLMKRFCDGG